MPLLNFQNLMGSPLGMAGLGLLMQPTQSYQPINPMAGIAQGMFAAGQYRQNEAQNAIEQRRAAMEQQRLQFEMEDSLRKREQEAIARAEADRKQAALQQWISQQPPEMQAIYGVDPGAAYAKSLEAQFSQPKLNATQENYERAKSEGFKGSFMDYQIAMANAKRPTTSISNYIGGEAKPVLTDAAQYVMPDGSAPLPTATPQEIVEAGGRVLTKDEQARRDQAAKMEAKNAAADAASGPAIQGYYSAVDAMRANPGADTIAAAYQQRKRMAQVLAQARNPGRAPTDADVELAMQDIPDPISISQMAGSIAGGDPFMARMQVIEQELGLSGSPNPVSASGAIVPNKDVDALVEKYTSGGRK